jgi:oxygen-dependent protoporphyrinogen oxidase
MAQLTETLVAQLDARAIQTNQRVTRIEQNAHGYTLHFADGTMIEADAVLCSTSAAIAADLVRNMDSELSAQLQTLRVVSSATVSLGYKRADVLHPLDGFGFVVPHAEGQAILGCTWSSVKFDFRARDGFALLRVFIGGAHDEHLAEGDDATLIQTATDAMRTMLGITAAPVHAQAFHWRKANPQYDVGHAARIAAIEARACTHPNFYLIGSSYHGVGIPDCIASATRAVSQL